jgi:UDP-N-acetylmuramoylalanine--D-glutamate ligase
VNLVNKKILVVGLGTTGVSVARFLSRVRAKVTVTDAANLEALGSRLEIISDLEITAEIGEHRTESFQEADLIVISPGVSHTIEPVEMARQKGTPIIGEIELASWFIDRPIVAVTGTNGKTTTTELIGAMLQSSGKRVYVGGNIGKPLIDYVDRKKHADVIVAEISSFQLDTIKSFRPAVSVLLNISADHMDRYADMQAYVQSKNRIFENQQPEDIAVLNGSDMQVRSLASALGSKKLFYPSPAENEAGAKLDSDRIVLSLESIADFEHLNAAAFKINTDLAGFRGMHNRENASAAALAALAAGATPDGVQNGLDNFRGSAHRLEYITTVDEVDYFNDSKATNVDAVVRALECFSQPIVLIMGGRDKGSDFSALVPAIRQHVTTLIVIGEAAERIMGALGQSTTIKTAANMKEAVDAAHRTSQPADAVLLSPGCASFDMYESYAQRGDDFRQTVNGLKKWKK